jgi:hypothetical protein
MTQAGNRGLVRYQRRDELRLGFPSRNAHDRPINGPPWVLGLFLLQVLLRIHSSNGLVGWPLGPPRVGLVGAHRDNAVMRGLRMLAGSILFLLLTLLGMRISMRFRYWIENGLDKITSEGRPSFFGCWVLLGCMGVAAGFVVFLIERWIYLISDARKLRSPTLAQFATGVGVVAGILTILAGIKKLRE